MYILSLDIGGTTFCTGLFTKNLECVYISKNDKIRNYDSLSDIEEAINAQINNILEHNHLNIYDIIGMGIACPGPLDSSKGKILNTPNLKFLTGG